MTDPIAIDSDLALPLVFIVMIMTAVVYCMWWLVDNVPRLFGR